MVNNNVGFLANSNVGILAISDVGFLADIVEMLLKLNFKYLNFNILFLIQCHLLRQNHLD